MWHGSWRCGLRVRPALMATFCVVAIVCSTLPAEAQPANDEKTAEADGHDNAALPAGAGARLGRPRAVLTGHITALAVSPDDRWLAVATQNRTNGHTQLAIVDAKTGVPKRTMGEGQSQHTFLTFSDDGRTLHAADQSWSVASGDKVSRPFEGNLIAVSPNRKYLAFVRPNDGQVVVWDAAKKSEVGAIGSREIPTVLNSAAITDDGKYFAHAANSQLQVIEIASAKALDPFLITQNNALVRALAIPGTSRFVTLGWGNRVAIVDPAAGKVVPGLEDEVKQAAVSPDGKWIACATARQMVRIWDPASGKVVKELAIEGYNALAIAYSADGKSLFAATERQSRDARLFIWDTETWEETSTENAIRGPMRRLIFSPDGKRLAADSVLGKIDLWNVAENRIEKTLTGDASFDLRFSPDGWLLGAAGARNSYAIWEVESGDQLFTGRANPAENNTAASFSPELDRLAVNRSGTLLRVVKITNGETVFQTPNQSRPFQGQPNALAYSPDGKLLAYTTDYYSGNAAGPAPITQLEIATGKVSRPFKADPTPPNPNQPYRRGARLYRAQWSPGGAMLAATDERGEINLWDVRSGDFLHGLGRCEIHPAFSPDGHFIASFGQQTLAVYEVHSGDEVFSRTLGAAEPNRGSSFVQPNSIPDTGLSAVAISPDGRLLAGAFRNDDTVLLWNLIPLEDEAVARLASATDGDHEQWWADLAGDSPRTAYTAVWRFALAGDEAIEFLETHMSKSPARANDPARIGQLITELDAELLADRKAAAQALRQLGEAALPALEEALKKNPSAEVKRAIAAIQQPSGAGGDLVAGEQLRRLRAIAALERSGSPRAADALASLAQGAEDRRETWYSKAALARVRSRHAR